MKITLPNRNGHPRGRSALTLTPFELIQLLAALIPPPQVHRHRYAGVLAPNSLLRQQVIATAGLAGVFVAGANVALGNFYEPADYLP